MLNILQKVRFLPYKQLPYLSNRSAVITRSFMSSRLLLNKHENEKVEKAREELLGDMFLKGSSELEGGAGAKDPNNTLQSNIVKDKKRRQRKTSSEIKRERYARIFYMFNFAGILGGTFYMARNWDDSETAEMKKGIENGYTLKLMYKRFKARFDSLFTFFQEPPFPDLLPPPLEHPYQRPLTLVLPLEDFLVHSEWTRKNGWRTAKRPGTDYFLGYLSQYYEIVLFSSNYMMNVEKIVEKLDSIHAFITYNLFKEHCVYKDGVHIKDLSHLNRDLAKTIIIDTDPNAFKLQPENAIQAKPWDGSADDGLLQYIPFLEYLGAQQTNDIRPILASFNDRKTIPEEFAKRVSRLREKFEHDQRAISQSWVSKLLGIGLTGKQIKFPLDLIREEGEKNYVRFIKIIEEEKEKLKLQQEAMGAQTFTLKDYVEGNIPSPEEQLNLQMEKQKEFEMQYKLHKQETQK